MELLPLETRAHILSFLDLNTLKSAVLTCKALNEAGETSSLYKNFKVSVTSDNWEKFHRKYNKYKFVQNFHFSFLNNTIIAAMHEKDNLNKMVITREINYNNVSPFELGQLIGKTKVFEMDYKTTWVYWNNILQGIGMNENPKTKIITLYLDEHDYKRLLYLHIWSARRLKESKLKLENFFNFDDYTINATSAEMDFFPFPPDFEDSDDSGLARLTVRVNRIIPTNNLRLFRVAMKSLRAKLLHTFWSSGNGHEM